MKFIGYNHLLVHVFHFLFLWLSSSSSLLLFKLIKSKSLSFWNQDWWSTTIKITLTTTTTIIKLIQEKKSSRKNLFPDTLTQLFSHCHSTNKSSWSVIRSEKEIPFKKFKISTFSVWVNWKNIGFCFSTKKAIRKSEVAFYRPFFLRWPFSSLGHCGVTNSGHIWILSFFLNLSIINFDLWFATTKNPFIQKIFFSYFDETKRKRFSFSFKKKKDLYFFLSSTHQPDLCKATEKVKIEFFEFLLVRSSYESQQEKKEWRNKEAISQTTSYSIFNKYIVTQK